MLVCWFVAFYVLQIVASLLFKYGANHPDAFWRSFAISNVLCAASIYFIMKIYMVMQVNLAGAVMTGGAFIAIQFALVWVFRERLTTLQYAGLLAIMFGIMLVSIGKPRELPAQNAIAASAR